PLDRAKVRTAFEERFTSLRMAEDYVEVYEDLIATRERTRRANLATRGTGRPLAVDLAPALAPDEKEAQHAVPGSSQNGAAVVEDGALMGINGAIRKVDRATAALRQLS